MLSWQSFARGIHDVFDGFGLLRSSTINLDDPAWTVAFDYDEDGDRRRVVHPDGKDFQYGYDGLDPLTSVTENATATALATLTYDTHGRRQQFVRGPGTGVGTTTYGYDGISRLQSLAHNLDGSATTNDVTFTFSSYNAAIGRFMQADPLGLGDDVNLYAYVKSDPMNGTDPFGLYMCRGSKNNCDAVEAGRMPGSRSDELLVAHPSHIREDTFSQSCPASGQCARAHSGQSIRGHEASERALNRRLHQR